jgi:4-hydroxy-tetrahydrodipicolinate synthase
LATFSGCYTALITPMNRDRQVDYAGLQQLVDFQIKNGAKGVLAVGTTGESPTLDWAEHSKVIEKMHEYANRRCLTIAGTGSNRRYRTCPWSRCKYCSARRSLL